MICLNLCNAFSKPYLSFQRIIMKGGSEAADRIDKLTVLVMSLLNESLRFFR